MNDNFHTGLNLRDWLESALTAKGAAFKGGGTSCDGDADIDIELEGMPYNVAIKPILRPAACPPVCSICGALAHVKVYQTDADVRMFCNVHTPDLNDPLTF